MDFFEESYKEILLEMKDETSLTLRNDALARRVSKGVSSDNYEYQKKFTDAVIASDDEPVRLTRSNPSFVAKMLSKLSNNIANNIARFRDYSITLDESVVGNLSINMDSMSEINIVWIGINSKYRGNGYAQSAIRLIMKAIQEEGFTTVTLEVPGESEDALHIYEKIGFKKGEVLSEDDVWGGLTSMTLDINDYVEPPKKSPGENTEIDEAGNALEDKPGVYKINYYLRDHLQTPNITKVLAKPKNRDTIVENVGRFIDTHSSQLGTSGPVYSFKFGDAEVKFLYDMFNITGDQIIAIFDQMVQETYYGKIAKFIDGFVKNSPHKVLITAVLIDALQNNYEDIVTCCEYMWAFSEYPLIYHHYWKTGVKEDVMDYTIEHLGSKFKVKKVSNLRGLLKYDAHSSVDFMTERLTAGVDHAYADLMNRMRSQINNTFRNIANAYYENDKNNATQHNRVTTFDDGTIADQEGFTTNVAQVVDRTCSKFTSGSINTSMVRIVADGASVDKDNLTGYINQVMAAKDNKITKIIENIITAYFMKYPTNSGVGTDEFINFGLTLYRSISTSKDPMYQEIRAILDHWMFDIIDIKQYYQRDGTIINYTRAIFNYLIFMINLYN